QGLLLIRLDRADAAAHQLSALAEEAPEVADRIDVLAAEALALGGDTAGVRVRLIPPEGDASLRVRSQRAWLRAYEESNDLARALDLARGFRAEASGADRA